MDERHIAEVIELKQTQLAAVKNSVSQEELDFQDRDTQMLTNLVKVKDEEIKSLKRQLGVAEMPENQNRQASPLRVNQQKS